MVERREDHLTRLNLAYVCVPGDGGGWDWGEVSIVELVGMRMGGGLGLG